MKQYFLTAMQLLNVAVCADGFLNQTMLPKGLGWEWRTSCTFASDLSGCVLAKSLKISDHSPFHENPDGFIYLISHMAIIRWAQIFFFIVFSYFNKKIEKS